MRTLTVFTCTYNRADTLSRTYESLCNQTCLDFTWLVIDDGSEDESRQLVEEWIENKKRFDIRYVYKKNEGLPSGYNRAIELIETELCVGIDSDDAMPEDAVEKIISCWKKYGSDKYAGIVALDYYFDGKKPLGGFLPNIKKIHLKDLIVGKHRHNGDKKCVHRTDLLKSVAPMPIYEGEKGSNPAYLFHIIDKTHPMLILNECICLVEYQKGGMSDSIYHQYKNSPRSFILVRKLYMEIEEMPFSYLFKQAIHYVSSSIFIGDYKFLRNSPKKMLTFFAIPFGGILNLFIRYKTRG